MRRFGLLILLISLAATGCFGNDNPANPVVEIGAIEELPVENPLPDLVPLQDEELPPLVPLGSNSDLGLSGDFCQDWIVVQGQTFAQVDMAGLMSLDAESPAWWGAIQSLWEAHAKQADWVSSAAPKNETEVIANAEALAEAFRSEIPLLTKESNQQVDGSGITFHYPIVYKYLLERCAIWMGEDLSVDDIFDGLFDFNNEP